jgi:hypothetical protein
MSLKDDVDARRREISSDQISMSVGELLNLYKDDELDIQPEFQRVFRWTAQQKSRLVESLLLGIPLPSIYVATNDKGVWEVIDGVQRLSTIFEFMGELRGPADADSTEYVTKPALVLEGTKHLPSLVGVTYETMDQALRLEFKRTRLDVKTLAREKGSTSTGKFDLFERLNTYGAQLSPQELRNCVLVSLNPLMYRWLKSLAEDENFRACTLLTESQLQERYDMDLALRFVTLRDVDPRSIGDVHEFLRDQMERIAVEPSFNPKAEEALFKSVFAYMNENLNGDSFRQWNDRLNAFRGPFSLGAYEGLGLSIGRHWPRISAQATKFDLRKLVKALWATDAYKKSFSGMRARERMVRVKPAAETVVLAELRRSNPQRARRAAPKKKA